MDREIKISVVIAEVIQIIRTKKTPKTTAAKSKQTRGANKSKSRQKSVENCNQVVDPLKHREVVASEHERANMLSGFRQALALLHVSAVPLIVPCREEEFSTVSSFVEGHLNSGTSGCMYVSGTPGTGKTATVMEAISFLKDQTCENGKVSFKFIDVNGMKLTSPNQVYSEIWHKLKGTQLGADAALSALEHMFLRESSKGRDHVVLLVDELDMLLTSKQEILYNLFEWPSSKANPKLVVLCIANTMDLPERVMLKRVSSRLGLTRVVFKPYTFTQLREIIASRVHRSEVFAESAIEFAARKMSALSGDARRALDICRRATELAQSSNSSSVSILHIKYAFAEMFQSKKIQALQQCSAHEKIILRGIVSEFRRCGIEEANMLEVYKQYKSICSLEGLLGLDSSLFLRATANLDAMKLVVFEGSKFGLRQKVILNANVDDINFAYSKS